MVYKSRDPYSQNIDHFIPIKPLSFWISTFLILTSTSPINFDIIFIININSNYESNGDSQPSLWLQHTL